MSNNAELAKVVRIRTAMEEYQDAVYINLIRQLNDDYKALILEDWGTEFVRNCGYDLAGEIVRNYFNTSDYYISVDQLARRMLYFTYDDDYNPLAENGDAETIRKKVYGNNEIMSERLNNITSVIEQSQEKLFTEERSKDKLDREKKAWRVTQKDENGDLYDDLTGEKGETSTRTRNGKEYEVSRLHADHIQSREAATYNGRYLKEDGVQRLREFYNSDSNFQLMLDSANTSKGDVRVYDADGKDITYKASPEQLADAICAKWEKETPSNKKTEELKKHGYLDENGKVTKNVKRELVRKIRHSQNAESEIILKNTNYGRVSTDALQHTSNAVWRIVAGQVLYYAAPPVIYEVKMIMMDKNIDLDNALEKFGNAGKRISNYVYANLKNVFTNIAENSLKTFIKSFVDILINLVKATIKRLLKIAKSLVLSTVDAVKVLLDKDMDSTHKADAVFNLFGITITSCVVDVLVEAIEVNFHFPDWLMAPLQIVTTVVCTNMTMLILKKVDLFDVNYGFKLAQIRKLFEETNQEYERKYELSIHAADIEIEKLIEQAKCECISIYENLQEINMYEGSIRGDVEMINSMFSVGINFEEDWERFIEVEKAEGLAESKTLTRFTIGTDKFIDADLSEFRKIADEYGLVKDKTGYKKLTEGFFDITYEAYLGKYANPPLYFTTVCVYAQKADGEWIAIDYADLDTENIRHGRNAKEHKHTLEICDYDKESAFSCSGDDEYCNKLVSLLHQLKNAKASEDDGYISPRFNREPVYGEILVDFLKMSNNNDIETYKLIAALKKCAEFLGTEDDKNFLLLKGICEYALSSQKVTEERLIRKIIIWKDSLDAHCVNVQTALLFKDIVEMLQFSKAKEYEITERENRFLKLLAKEAEIEDFDNFMDMVRLPYWLISENGDSYLSNIIDIGKYAYEQTHIPFTILDNETNGLWSTIHQLTNEIIKKEIKRNATGTKFVSYINRDYLIKNDYLIKVKDSVDVLWEQARWIAYYNLCISMSWLLLKISCFDETVITDEQIATFLANSGLPECYLKRAVDDIYASLSDESWTDTISKYYEYDKRKLGKEMVDMFFKLNK